jgi:flagellar biosynthetic protein FliQ
MSTDLIMGIAAETMKVTLLVSGPVLLVGLIVGLVISIFQAVTQVHEMTLAFVPKIVAVMLALLFTAPWMIDQLVSFTHNLFTNIPNYVK